MPFLSIPHLLQITLHLKPICRVANDYTLIWNQEIEIEIYPLQNVMKDITTPVGCNSPYNKNLWCHRAHDVARDKYTYGEG
jgi:hypothetical protein